MTSLHQQDCNEIGADLAALDDSSISSRLSAMAFANVVAQIAHQQDHHPRMVIEYKTCTVMYSTHSVSGISIKDFICAAKINQALTL